jgi:signal transduction histidine kinase
MSGLRWPAAWRGLPDALLAVVLGLAALFGTVAGERSQPGRIPLDAGGAALALAAAGALAFRRRAPLAVLGFVTAAISAYLILGYPYGPAIAPLVVAIYTVAVQLPAGRSLGACAVALAGVLAEPFWLAVSRSPGRLAAVLPWAGWLLVPWAAGTVVSLARRAREDESRQRANAERLRIAREMHDVVGHGLAAINMQAQVALHVLDRRPEQARLALDAISQSSQDALGELRATLAVVRAPGGAAGDGDGRRPAATLTQLDRLVSRMVGSGLHVTVKINGERPDLPTAVDLAGYRIIQESLTNVLRHAGPATATVGVDYQPDALVVEVLDDGSARPGRPARVGGNGITGMSDRAGALGGTLTAGPRPGGGFGVHARLPIPAPGAPERGALA